MNWQVQEAKQRFSELVRKAEEDGPQTVTRNGREVVVVVEAGEFHRLTGPLDFKEFIRSGPGFDDLELDRDRGLPREIDLGG